MSRSCSAPLEQLEKGEGLEGVARGIAFQLAEELGVLDRARVAEEVKGFSQEDRAALRKLGVRFGAYHIYLPLLLKPAPRALAALLWALKHGGLDNVKGLDEVPHLAASGRTSFAADQSIPKGFYRAAGFRVCGERVVRVDILERLADLIRPAIAYRPGRDRRRSAARRRRWRRFRRHRRDDLAHRLLGRGFRLDSALARLCVDASAGPGDHRAAARRRPPTEPLRARSRRPRKARSAGDRGAAEPEEAASEEAPSEEDVSVAERP